MWLSFTPLFSLSYVHTNRDVDVDVWTIEMDECVILLSLCICDGTSHRSLWHLPNKSLVYMRAWAWVWMSVFSYFVVDVVVAWQIYSTRLFVFLSSHERWATSTHTQWANRTLYVLHMNGFLYHSTIQLCNYWIHANMCSLECSLFALIYVPWVMCCAVLCSAPKRWWWLSVWTLSTLFYRA